jgi:FkbH-like protein
VKFLEAKKVVTEQKEGVPLRFLLAMSGTSEQLELYLRAHAARAGMTAVIEVLPFGTLGQHLRAPALQGSTELFVLLPWDLAPECDWRSGMGADLADADAIVARAEQVAALLASRSGVRLAYLPAPIPPICGAQADNQRLAAELLTLATRLGAEVIDGDTFAMAPYLASGCPIGGSSLSRVAETLVGLLIAPPPEALKVLVTDADNTLWAGIVGEDGIDSVSAEPQGGAFRHFIYQGFLKRLKAAGILLAVVSRNDEDMVRAPFTKGRMPLAVEDFVAIRAGYGVKSDHVAALAEILNLGLDSIIFVDDNPVELAEVAAALPLVTCLEFPVTDDKLPVFLRRLATAFDRPKLTLEDAGRTEMYRRRLASLPPTESAGLSEFLADLSMVLIPREWRGGNWSRAFQLINKTNQFNLNGERLSEAEMSALLANGGRLFTAALEDRIGTHGEILACLVDASGQVRSLVLSCRVFQRRVEYAFLVWLISRLHRQVIDFAFVYTERNEPMRRFLADTSFRAGADSWSLDCASFVGAHASDLAIFSVREEVS